uniref:ATP synthase F0 subunit 8 n=1 Tax=Trochocyathus caryophylloides TaxID=2962710 RepID=UPI002176AE9C|nr:ATP synthase F0 subunit 8 [Trochocyathus caryophylloides]UUF92229.1 ATP synthase subunit 8 [Trochocyathus caryophylloides]
MPQLNTMMFLAQYGYTCFLFFVFLLSFFFILFPQGKKNGFFRKKISEKRVFKKSLFIKSLEIIWL